MHSVPDGLLKADECPCTRRTGKLPVCLAMISILYESRVTRRFTFARSLEDDLAIAHALSHTLAHFLLSQSKLLVKT